MVGIWGRFIRSWRSLIEAGQAFSEGELLEALDQEVRLAAERVNADRHSLKDLVARQEQAGEGVRQLKAGAAEYEEFAYRALDKGDESLAREVASKIAQLEQQCLLEERVEASLDEEVGHLRAELQSAERRVQQLKQQADTVRASERIRHARLVIAERHGHAEPKLYCAMDAARRMRESQHAQKSASKEEILSNGPANDSLRERLVEAGLILEADGAQSVLERIKKQRREQK